MNFPKLFKNSFFLFFARIASSFFSLFVVVIIARNQGVEALGKFALVYSYFLIFTEIPLLGLNIFISRELAKKYGSFKHFFFIGNALSYISVIILILILFLVISFAGYSADVCRALFWVLLAVLPSGFITVSQAFFLAFEKIKLMSFIVIAENFLRSLGAVIILVSGGDFVHIFFLFLILRFVFVIVNYISLKRAGMLPESFTWDNNLFVFTLKHWPVFSSIYIISILISRIDQVLLSKLSTISAVGIYSASYKFLDFFLMAPTALSLVMFPFFSRMDLREENSKEVVTVIIKYFSIAAVPLIAFFFFCSKEFIAFFYGSKFSASALVLSILMCNFLITGCDQILGLLMISQDKLWQDLKFLAITLTFYVASLFILIPRYQYAGAAIATVASSALLIILKFRYLSLGLYKINFRAFLKNFLFAVILFISFHMLRMFIPINSFLTWVYFSLVYICGLVIFKIVTNSEIKIISLAVLKTDR